MFKFNFTNNRGFTMIEALVAITVLVIGVLGPIVLAVRNIPDGNFLKNKMTAIYLAKEGVELLRNKFDSTVEAFINSVDASDINSSNNILNSNFVNALECLNDDGAGTKECNLSLDNVGKPIISPCDPSANGDCSVVVGVSGPSFRRVLKIYKVLYGGAEQFREFRAVVTVSWEEKGKPQSVSLTRFFYDI